VRTRALDLRETRQVASLAQRARVGVGDEPVARIDDLG